MTILKVDWIDMLPIIANDGLTPFSTTPMNKHLTLSVKIYMKHVVKLEVLHSGTQNRTVQSLDLDLPYTCQL